LRIRIALTLGALVLAGGALTGGIALASQPAPTAPSAQPTETTRPAPPQSTRPGPSATVAPVPATSRAAKPAQVLPGAPRVPRAVPAGPTGDLHLPAIGETR
jgi:hypothetical protein